MINVKIYIVEDNIRYRIDLKNEINKYSQENESIYNFEVLPINNYIHFYENLKKHDIKSKDIFIIDIQLNTYFNGIQLAKRIREISKECKIIFLTSITDKAIDIINQKIFPNAYLVKSSDLEIIQLQLIDLFNTINLDSCKTLTVTANSVNFILNSDDILYVSSLSGFRKKLNIQTLESNLVIDGSLFEIKKHLPSPPFYLDLKSFIINCNNIKSISKIDQVITFKNDFELELNIKLIYKLLKFQKGLK